MDPSHSLLEVLRFGDILQIEVVLVNRKEQPSFGAGETPIMGIAPAIGAAIFDAVGIRPRGLPMARGGLDLSGAPAASSRGG